MRKEHAWEQMNEFNYWGPCRCNSAMCNAGPYLAFPCWRYHLFFFIETLERVVYFRNSRTFFNGLCHQFLAGKLLFFVASSPWASTISQQVKDTGISAAGQPTQPLKLFFQPSPAGK